MEPYQVQALQAKVDLETMLKKGELRIPQSSSITGVSPSIFFLALYAGHSLGEESYPSAETQSTGSVVCVCVCVCVCVWLHSCIDRFRLIF